MSAAAATPSRRACLFGAVAPAAATVVGSGVPASGAPAAVSPEIAAAVAAYWAGVAEANARGASDGLIDLKCEEIEAAAAKLAAAPCRGIADLAAKVAFFVEVMNHQNAWGHVTSAEGDVLVSVETAALALGGAA